MSCFREVKKTPQQSWVRSKPCQGLPQDSCCCPCCWTMALPGQHPWQHHEGTAPHQAATRARLVPTVAIPPTPGSLQGQQLVLKVDTNTPLPGQDGVRRLMSPPPACHHLLQEMLGPRAMGKDEEQGEEEKTPCFQGPQLLAEANGLTQAEEAG